MEVSAKYKLLRNYLKKTLKIYTKILQAQQLEDFSKNEDNGIEIDETKEIQVTPENTNEYKFLPLE